MMAIKAVVFDLGGVLFDWNPEYLYGELIPDAERRRWFLEHVCNGEWNHQQDGGRPLDEATRDLVARHPDHAPLIEAYYGEWPRMLRGTLPEGVALFEALERAGMPLFALTNWASDTFALTRRRHALLGRFLDIVVSGDERLTKPDRAIYALMQERMRLRFPTLDTAEVAFIDDVERNVVAAQAFGWHVIHHVDPAATAQRLRDLGVNFAQ
jgi:2-haloacid dehalogenase